MIVDSARFGTREVAAMFGVSRGWIARQCKAGALPCSFVAGRYRFTPQDIEAIAAKFRREARPLPGPRVIFGTPPDDATRVTVSKRRPALDVRKWARG